MANNMTHSIIMFRQ